MLSQIDNISHLIKSKGFSLLKIQIENKNILLKIQKCLVKHFIYFKVEIQFNSIKLMIIRIPLIMKVMKIMNIFLKGKECSSAEHGHTQIHSLL